MLEGSPTLISEVDYVLKYPQNLQAPRNHKSEYRQEGDWETENRLSLEKFSSIRCEI